MSDSLVIDYLAEDNNGSMLENVILSPSGRDRRDDNDNGDGGPQEIFRRIIAGEEDSSPPRSSSHFEFPDTTYSELDRLTRGDFDFNEVLFEPSSVDAQEAAFAKEDAAVLNNEKQLKKEDEEEDGGQQNIIINNGIQESSLASSNYRYFASLESARRFCEQTSSGEEFGDAVRADREKKRKQAADAAKNAKKAKKRKISSGGSRQCNVNNNNHHNHNNHNTKIFPFRLHELASSENFQPLNWAVGGEDLLGTSSSSLLAVDLATIHAHLEEICSTKKYSSFLRQLHLYGFRKVGRCPPKTRHEAKLAFYQHASFQQGKPELLSQMERCSALSIS